jgi:hypothetical protein
LAGGRGTREQRGKARPRGWRRPHGIHSYDSWLSILFTFIHSPGGGTSYDSSGRGAGQSGEDQMSTHVHSGSGTLGSSPKYGVRRTSILIVYQIYLGDTAMIIDGIRSHRDTGNPDTLLAVFSPRRNLLRSLVTGGRSSESPGCIRPIAEPAPEPATWLLCHTA